jgi:hypothetical protein
LCIHLAHVLMIFTGQTPGSGTCWDLEEELEQFLPIYTMYEVGKQTLDISIVLVCVANF